MIVLRAATFSILLFLISLSFYAFGKVEQEGGLQNKSLKVLYLADGYPEQIFWQMQNSVLAAVAESLNIELVVEYVQTKDGIRIPFTQRLQQAIQLHSELDFILGPMYFTGENRILEMIDEVKIPYFSVNFSISDDKIFVNGKPREKFKYWMGHMSPGDELAGYHLAQSLLLDTQAPELVVITGRVNDIVSINRVAGLQHALREMEANPKHIYPTTWRFRDGELVGRLVQESYPEANRVWTVSDQLAAGFVKAYKSGVPEGMQVGTFDWTPNTVELIKKGIVDTSYGGHFVEGGSALLMIYDFAHGHDFESELGTIIETHLYPLDKSNVAVFEHFIDKKTWQNIDFKQFSKVHNPSLERRVLNVFDLMSSTH